MSISPLFSSFAQMAAPRLLSHLLPASANVVRETIERIFPARCIQCGRHVSSPHTLCGQCWQHIPFFFPPWCSKCGLPLKNHPPEQKHYGVPSDDTPQFCIFCLRHKKAFSHARSVFAYVPESQQLILQMKHHDALHAVPALSLWMARMIHTTLADFYPDAGKHHPIPIVPVPAHSESLSKRRHYPTARIAQAVAKVLGSPFLFAPCLLERTRAHTQRGQNSKGRIQSIRHDYRLHPKSLAALPAYPLAILIDDVMTTGATASLCSQKLRGAGIPEVLVCTAARVPRILPRHPAWLTDPPR